MFREVMRSTLGRVLVIVLAVLLTVCGTMAIYIFAKLGRISYAPAPGSPARSQPSGYGTAAEAETEIEEGLFSEKGVFNILLIGTDDYSPEFYENARSDSMILLSVNKNQNTVKLVSLERAIGVFIPQENQKDWLTHVFAYGGADQLLSTIRSNFKVDVNRYVRVNFYSFRKLVDAIGGIDLTLTPEEAAALSTLRMPGSAVQQTFRAGEAHLDGEYALLYARLRSIDSDWKRVERQRKVLQAAMDKAPELSLLTLDRLANELLPLVQTNFSKAEIASLMLEAPAYIGARMGQMTLPVKGSFWNEPTVDGRSLTAVDFDTNAKVLHEFLYGNLSGQDGAAIQKIVDAGAARREKIKNESWTKAQNAYLAASRAAAEEQARREEEERLALEEAERVAGEGEPPEEAGDRESGDQGRPRPKKSAKTSAPSKEERILTPED